MLTISPSSLSSHPLFSKEISHSTSLATSLPSPSLPPLFLLHGWGRTHSSLTPLAELLAKEDIPCHLFDLPGFGCSPQPNTIWNSFDYAERLAHYAEDKELPPITLLGHSFGGKVALSFAIRYPKKVSKLILVASSGLAPKRSPLQKARHISIKWSGKLLRKSDHLFGTGYFTTHFANRFGSRDYKEAGSMRPILVRSVNEDLTPFLSQIKCPTLIIWGGRDRETSPEMGHRLAKEITHSSLLYLPWHDHTPFNDVGAHLLATHILDFLKEGL